MKKWLGFALSVLLLVSAQAAQAAGAASPSAATPTAAPPKAQQFATVLQNPGHRQLVLQAAQATPAWAHSACANASFAPVPEIGVYLPVVFDKDGVPVSGEWREAVTASGCGAPLTLNVLTQISAPGALATGYLLPGNTIADPVLQNAAQVFAVKAAGGIPPGCKDGFIADTEFTGYEGPDAASKTGPWKELWTLDLCGPARQVVVHFRTDATGTTIDAAPAPASQTAG